MFRRMMNRTIAVVALLLITVTAALTQTVSVVDVNANLPEPVFRLFGRAGLYKTEIRANTWFAGKGNAVTGETLYFNGEVMDIRKNDGAIEIDLTGTFGNSATRQAASLFLSFKAGKVSMTGAFTLAPTSPLSGRMTINYNAVSSSTAKLKPGKVVRIAFSH